MDAHVPPERPPLKLVSIGSISAASLLINGFFGQREAITAIVSTTDTGSSTGVIREKFSMPAPGDIRAVVAAMGEETGVHGVLKKLFEYRFKPDQFPELPNMSLGNLVLAALMDMTKDFSKAVTMASEIVGCRGTILPVTVTNANIKAKLANGCVVRGEAAVRRVGKPPIRELFLENDAVVLTNGIDDAVMSADMVVMGPGCLYTSIISCLLVPGLAGVLRRTGAKVVYCCNTTTTPGQTDGMSVLEHVACITHYLGDTPPDYVLINNKRPRPEVEEAYRSDAIYLLLPAAYEVEQIKAQGCTPVLADLLEEGWKGKRSLHKLDSIRHDAGKIRAALMSIDGKEG
ncbi:MAG: YvcK family protein [Deltaproteobacteria bacterium]|nr:YvcK family protein [Deltaproteobacteria bacterium]